MYNYYEILGISTTAEETEIKKAFRLNAVKYHPDKHFGDTYFEEKFKLINEAYRVLIDHELRDQYDREFLKTINASVNHQESSIFTGSSTYKSDTKEEANFQYNPHKPFYSFFDRFENSTPQFPPLIDHWGNPLSPDNEFPLLPKNIGKIISGYSTLKKTDQPMKPLKAFLNVLLSVGIGVAISTAIILIFNVTSDIWRVIWFLVFGGGLGFLRFSKNQFQHTWNFIGVNGFAEFECEGERSNITKSVEVNFNQVTDLFNRFEVRKYNLQYQNTAYQYVWLNYQTDNVVYEANSLHYDKENNPPKQEAMNYWLNREAEKYWTVYLLDTMEGKLVEKGYLEFNVFGKPGPFIKIGVGYIAFIKGSEEFTYRFNDIRKIYTKGSDLYIEHKNFEKVLFFFRSGNSDKIPLTNLCNRQFFFKAMEIFLGYRFS